MKPLVPLLFALLAACAAHNSHRVAVEPLALWTPLVDEALAGVEASWGGPLPSASLGISVTAEPVEARWGLRASAPDESVAPLSQAELAPLIADDLERRLGLASAPELVELVLHVALATDLHDPDEIGLLVSCALVDAREPERVLAGGTSSCVKLERLYCHGCRDASSGHGSSLGSAVETASEGYLFLGTWCDLGSGSSGYVKTH